MTTSVCELNRTIAHEIHDEFRGYTGLRWQRVDGREKAVRFIVHSRSLEGKRPRDLQESRNSAATSISQVTSGSYRDSAGYTRYVRLLQNVHIDLEIVDGMCTGNVTVSETSSDYD